MLAYAAIMSAIDKTIPNVREAIRHRTAERRASEPLDRREESFVKWIPIVVPLFAVLIAVAVYFIGATVL